MEIDYNFLFRLVNDVYVALMSVLLN